MAGETALGDTPDATGRGWVAVGQGYVDLARPPNTVALASFTLVGAYVAAGRDGVSPAAVAALVTALEVVGGFAINDYFDRDVDRINDPDRPIPRGAVTPRGALLVTGLSLGLAVVVTVVALPPLAGGLVGANVVALVAYTPLVKGRYGLGNLLVSALVGGAALLGGVAAGLTGPVVVMALLAVQMLFGLEVLKDLEDTAGDERAGLQTLPVVVGERRAVQVVLVVLAATVPLSLVPYLRGTFGLSYLGVILVAHVLTGVTMWATVRRPPATALRWIMASMLVCMAAFVAGQAF